MRLCEEGTTPTPDSKGYNKELNDLFLPVPLPALHLLNFLSYCQSTGNFPTSATDGF